MRKEGNPPPANRVVAQSRHDALQQFWGEAITHAAQETAESVQRSVTPPARAHQKYARNHTGTPAAQIICFRVDNGLGAATMIRTLSMRPSKIYTRN